METSYVPKIKESIGVQSWKTERNVASVALRSIVTGVAMSAACGAAMLVSGAARSGSPWAGINSMATAFGIGPKRAPKRFAGATSVAAAAILVGGLIGMAAVYEGALVATRKRRTLGTGLLVALGGVALDRFVLSDNLVPNFVRTMGKAGTSAKYAALGLAAAAPLAGR